MRGNGRTIGRLAVSCLGVIIAPAAALGAEIKFEVPDAREVHTVKAAYACGEKRVTAEYINAGSTSLVLLNFDGLFVVASNVLSGSGARYAGRQYIWWTKGDHADLYDMTKGEDAPPISCAVKR